MADVVQKLPDPYQGFMFRVQIQDFTGVAHFTKVSGLSRETEVIDYRAGDSPPTNQKLIGITTYGNVTLERGIDKERSIRTWVRQVANSKKASFGDEVDPRKTVRIQLLDSRDGKTVLREWTLTRAIPSMDSVGDLDAGSSDVLIQTIELAHEGLVEEFVGTRQS